MMETYKNTYLKNRDRRTWNTFTLYYIIYNIHVYFKDKSIIKHS